MPHNAIGSGSLRADFSITPSTWIGTNVTIWSSPASGAQIGGDWCDVVTISDDVAAFTIGDVSGHGEAVADTMATMRACVLPAIHDIQVPSDVLFVANRVAANHGDGVIVTAVVAFLNHRRRTLTFANAGHPPPLMMTRGQHAFLAQQPADLPLGVFAHHHAANYVFAVPEDALVVFYTDGVTEHDRDPVRGEAELAEAARIAYGRPDADAAHTIARHIFRNGCGRDDAAAMVVRSGPVQIDEHQHRR